jgi:hypothetical protein
MSTKKCKSPYCRGNKKPYVYSVHYREWRRGMLVGDREAANVAAEAHERQFGYQRKRKYISQINELADFEPFVTLPPHSQFTSRKSVAS